MEPNQLNNPSDEADIVCSSCGTLYTYSTICPCCGSTTSDNNAASKATNSGMYQNPRIEQSLPTKPRVNNNYCPECFGQLHRVPDRLGIILTISGIGILSILSPIMRSLVITLAGFFLLAFGMWKQAYPKFSLKCSECNYKRS